MTDITARPALVAALTPDNDNMPAPEVVQDESECVLPFPQRATRRVPVMRRYVDREMTVAQMLADPIVRAIMARDGVTDEAVYAALRDALPVS